MCATNLRAIFPESCFLYNLIGLTLPMEINLSTYLKVYCPAHVKDFRNVMSKANEKNSFRLKVIVLWKMTNGHDSLKRKRGK